MNIFGSMNDCHVLKCTETIYLHSNPILTCHHTCKLYSIYMIMELTVVHHSMYNTSMSKNNHVNCKPVSCLIYHISSMYVFNVFFGWSTSDHVYWGGCNWNMSNIFWEMFYNIIYHIFEGGLIFGLSPSPN